MIALPLLLSKSDVVLTFLRRFPMHSAIVMMDNA